MAPTVQGLKVSKPLRELHVLNLIRNLSLIRVLSGMVELLLLFTSSSYRISILNGLIKLYEA